MQKLIKGWALLDAVCDSIVCKGDTLPIRDREEQVLSSFEHQSSLLIYIKHKIGSEYLCRVNKCILCISGTYF